MKRLLTAAVVLLCLVACSGAEQTTDTPVPPTSTATHTPIPPTPTATATPASLNLEDIVYYGNTRLDVYLPDREDRLLPTVLLLHGGGGTKLDLRWLADDLAALGYAVVAPTWSPIRLAAENGLCSLAWLHTNAEIYGFDPQRIAIFGYSGGGTVGALVAAIDEPAEFQQECTYNFPGSGAVQGLVSYAGSFLMPDWYLTQGKDLFDLVVAQELQIPGEEAQGIRQALLDTPFERWRDISGFSDDATRFIHTFPPAWIDGSEPPMLLIHGGQDTFIDKLESEAFAALLESKGVEVELLIIPSAGHGLFYSEPGFDETWDAAQAFLAQLFK